jgi:hypothetical protein
MKLPLCPQIDKENIINISNHEENISAFKQEKEE